MALSIAGVLTLGRTHLRTQATTGLVAQAGVGMGAQGASQTITRADALMQAWFPERFQALPFLDGVQFEGERRHWFEDNEHGLLAFVDEVDGSQNQLTAGGQQLIHCAVVTLVDVPQDRPIMFSDIVAAVMLNYLDGSVVYAFRTGRGTYTTETIGNTTLVPHERKPKLLATGGNRLDIGNWQFFAEQYYPEIREAATKMFAGRKGNLRSLGNSAWEAILASLGYATGFMSNQKHDEIGAIWTIALGVGAYVRTLEGKLHLELPLPIGEKGNIGLIVAPNQEIGEHIVELYRQATSSPSTS